MPELAFRKIGLISRPRRSNLSEVVPPLLRWLEQRGVHVTYDEETAGSLNDSSKGHSREHVAATSELLLVLGGDGTLLAAARVASAKGIPILPINMGSLGFLTSFMLEELYPALEDILAGRLTISERVMLHVELHRAGKIIDKQTVLNEVVVNKGALARMIELELSIDNTFVCRYRADGLIVASPNRLHRLFPFRRRPDRPSVGRVVYHHPDLPAHSQRPPGGGTRHFHHRREIVGGTESVFLTLDGQKGIPLQATDHIGISRAAQLLKLIQTPKKSYFEILRNKLKWGEA